MLFLSVVTKGRMIEVTKVGRDVFVKVGWLLKQRLCVAVRGLICGIARALWRRCEQVFRTA